MAAIVCSFSVSYGQQVFMQGWYWDYPKTAAGASWADTLRIKAASLKTAGFTHIWFPPHAVSAAGPLGNGYDAKDLFIGNQTTGLGTRTAVNNMLAEFTAQSIRPVADLNYNHRAGGAPENNPAVKDYITNQYTAAKEPFPSDRFRCVLPVGGASGHGAGDYYFKISSKTGDNRFNNFGYKVYMQTNRTGNAGLPAQNETEPNGGGDCGQGNNLIQLGRDMYAMVETGGGCNTDEFHLVLGTNDFFAAGDSIFIYLDNTTTNSFSDHRIYGIYSSFNSADVVSDLLYQTNTNFNNLPSGRGQMNFESFKPNTTNAATTSLNGDWDYLFFNYDYDQFQKRTKDTLIDWTKWNWDALGVRGLRLDAAKNYTPSFVSNMLDSMHTYGKDPDLVVGEYFSANTSDLANWITTVTTGMTAGAQAVIKPKLFDFALREQLRQSCDNNAYDVRNVFTNSLHDAQGVSGFNIVTFANNHDFRDLTGFNSLIRNSNDLPYVYMLTNNQLGVPEIFYPDYYGYPAPAGGFYSYHPTNLPARQSTIDSLINILHVYINGSPTVDYLNRIGTPYSSNYITGSASRSLIYQLEGTAANGNRDIIVAINFGDTRLQADHQINNRGGAITAGTRFYDVTGRSAFPYQQVDGSGRVYIDLPARSFSVWSENSLIVPVTLLSFKATPADGKVVLQWKTENELNTDKYTAERSLNGTDFTPLGDVAALNNGAHTYTFNDEVIPKASILYYRIKIRDFNGSVHFSDIAKVNFSGVTFGINIYPNPVTGDKLSLAIETASPKNLQLSIYNIQGQKMLSQQIPGSSGIKNYPINISTLAAGSYTIVVDDGVEKLKKQFVRQ